MRELVEREGRGGGGQSREKYEKKKLDGDYVRGKPQWKLEERECVCVWVVAHNSNFSFHTAVNDKQLCSEQLD